MATYKLTVLKGENLVPKDPNGLSDPFLKVGWMKSEDEEEGTDKAHHWKWLGKPAKSATFKKTLNPDFAFEVDLGKVPEGAEWIVVEVFDYDMLSKNDWMGCVLLSVKHGKTAPFPATPFPIRDRSDHSGKEIGGTLTLALTVEG